ncbi:hypothetical protein BDV95DRAFT_612776 [Massariosphaeria phaeospora]|uniref:Uncharacterized protein n=1 Tax=Massariosphaeria phaeospora TaxID=100035 RepID=A0A7C8I1D6_9PLEO|nr:hypothetical protein BDV95DRAFT_612776 [Massariosphaeria phaeospora]
MADPDLDRAWKPNGRPQSTVARNFMSELDDLFRLDGGLDTLDKNVHQKKQAVSTHAQELEALEARLRETEERLNKAKTSPPRRSDSRRRTPIQSTFPEEDKSGVGRGSPLAANRKPRVDALPTRDMPGALPETPASYNSTEYVLVDRPRTSQNEDGGTV